VFDCFNSDYSVLVLFAFVVLAAYSIFSTTPGDWLGRTSPK